VLGDFVGASRCSRVQKRALADDLSQAVTLEEELATIARAAELFKSLRE
jgi:hypothetical protein